MYKNFKTEWTGAYPCLCNGEWILTAETTEYDENGRIDIDCPYDDFLECVVACAVSEVDRLYSVNEEIGQANKELCEDLSSIRAETEF